MIHVRYYKANTEGYYYERSIVNEMGFVLLALPQFGR
jgi:hypothetical protein